MVVRLAFIIALLGFPLYSQKLSLSGLMDVKVTAVSKRAQSWMDVPASVTVITAEDIRTSGYQRLQDVLAEVPGFFIADESWGVGKMGLRDGANPFPNSMIFLLDGIPLISPTSGGTHFKYLEIPLEIIERIEVLRGPGGTAYGAGSATGVVSIHTRRSGLEESCTVQSSAGSERLASAFGQCGFDLGEKSAGRVWMKGFRHDGFLKSSDFIEKNPIRLVRGPSGSGTVLQKVLNPFSDSREKENEKLFGGVDFFSEFGKWTGRLQGLWSWAGIRDFQKEVKQNTDPTIRLGYGEGQQILASGRLEGPLTSSNEAYVQLSHRFARYSFMSANAASLGEETQSLELQDFQNLPGGHVLTAALNLRRIRFRHETSSGDNLHFLDPKATQWLWSSMVGVDFRLPFGFTLGGGVKDEAWTLIKPEPEILPAVHLGWRPLKWLSMRTGWTRSITTPGYLQSNLELRYASVPVPQDLALFYPEAANDPGIWAGIVNSENLRPADYRTWEGGARISKGHLSADFSLFQTEAKDLVETISGGDTETRAADILVARYNVPENLWPLFYPNGGEPSDPFVSQVSGDSIIPFFYQNSGSKTLKGSELILRYRSLDFDIAASWSYLDDNNLEYDIPRTPRHIFRLVPVLRYGSTWTLRPSLQIRSAYSRGESYDWSTATLSYFSSSQDIYPTPIPKDWQTILNVALEGPLGFQGWSWQVWGRDLLEKEHSDYWGGVNNLYPHTTGRMVGFTMTAKF